MHMENRRHSMLFSNDWKAPLRLIAFALLGCCMVAPGVADSSPSSQSITLEIIVKFSDESDAGHRIDRILKEHPEDLSMLVDLQGELHQSTGFVLIPERVTSGRELIFRIPEKPALEMVKQTVTKRPEIFSAELTAVQNENPRLPSSVLLLRFRGSGDEAELLQKAYAEGAYGERVQALTARLCADSDIPVLGTAQAGAELAVVVDRYALLEKLVTRMNALEDVDYAQPNSTVQFMK